MTNESTPAAPSGDANQCRIELVVAVHGLMSQIENTLYAFRDDAEALRQARGAIDHAREVASRWNWNGSWHPDAAAPPAKAGGVPDLPWKPLSERWSMLPPRHEWVACKAKEHVHGIAQAARNASTAEGYEAQRADIELQVRRAIEAIDALAAPRDSTEQALDLYVTQEEQIKAVLDELAPTTTGNLQSRIRALAAGGVPADMVPAREPAPPNSLPTWSECQRIIENAEFRKRASAGLEGSVLDTPPTTPEPTELHRFIYEYDDANPYGSSWFLHRLEVLLNEVRAAPAQSADMVLVPREPTKEMLKAGYAYTLDVLEVWQAMLAASTPSQDEKDSRSGETGESQ